jgi:hypothetical protein
VHLVGPTTSTAIAAGVRSASADELVPAATTRHWSPLSLLTIGVGSVHGTSGRLIIVARMSHDGDDLRDVGGSVG